LSRKLLCAHVSMLSVGVDPQVVEDVSINLHCQRRAANLRSFCSALKSQTFGICGIQSHTLSVKLPEVDRAVQVKPAHPSVLAVGLSELSMRDISLYQLFDAYRRLLRACLVIYRRHGCWTSLEMEQSQPANQSTFDWSE
jgi:hypothetical protein